MVASLVLFYAPASRNQQGDLAHDETAVAKVGSENVTVAELATQKENMNRLTTDSGEVFSRFDD